ncbi:MAG: aminopeptidase P family protein [Candidatus Zixiibacteriota bacterium]
MYKERIRKLQTYLKSENLDGYLINQRSELIHMADVRYLSGFTGDTGLMVVLNKSAFLIVDGRFHTQAAKEAKNVRIINARGLPVVELEKHKQFQTKNLRLGFNPEGFLLSEIKLLKEKLPHAALIESPDAIANLSIIKSKDEIKLIQGAIDIAETALERLLGYIKPGLREIEVAAELEYQMKMLGAEKPAFDTIVASGYRSALPHGVASTKKIAKGDFVTIDYGAKYNGYVSDITRNFVIGKATPRQKKIYDVVLRANMAGIKKIKSGVSGLDVDKAARQVIERAKLGKYYNHGLGHGIGIYVHVQPNLGPRSTSVLQSNMVTTVEPGIYIPKYGGVRIEDDVLVTNKGCKVLTSSPKKLLEL